MSLLKQLLEYAPVYRGFSNLTGAYRSRNLYVQQYVLPQENERVLDIGCGNGDILLHLPSVEYVGFDANDGYIQFARSHYQERGAFFCGNVTSVTLKEMEPFDLVMANGVLHHLADDEAVQLLRLAGEHLRPCGRFVAIDPCLAEGQSVIARWMVQNDRGAFVRDQAQYKALANDVFPEVAAELRHDLLRLPYTHNVLVCRKAKQPVVV